MMNNEDKFSWKKRALSFRFAWQGLMFLFKNEHNAWIHLVVTICVIACAVIWKISVTEWCLISLCIAGVLAAEAFNSAIEALADKISPQKDSLIGKAKDLGAAAVLIMALGSVAVGLIIFLPKFIG